MFFLNFEFSEKGEKKKFQLARHSQNVYMYLKIEFAFKNKNCRQLHSNVTESSLDNCTNDFEIVDDNGNTRCGGEHGKVETIHQQ